MSILLKKSVFGKNFVKTVHFFVKISLKSLKISCCDNGNRRTTWINKWPIRPAQQRPI